MIYTQRPPSSTSDANTKMAFQQAEHIHKPVWEGETCNTFKAAYNSKQIKFHFDDCVYLCIRHSFNNHIDTNRSKILECTTLMNNNNTWMDKHIQLRIVPRYRSTELVFKIKYTHQHSYIIRSYIKMPSLTIYFQILHQYCKQQLRYHPLFDKPFQYISTHVLCTYIQYVRFSVQRINTILTIR